MSEMRKIKCPFCDAGEIDYFYQPKTVRKRVTGYVKGNVPSSEVEEIRSDCTNCGKTKKEIQEKLKNPSKAPKNSEVIERLRAMGLPTKI